MPLLSLIVIIHLLKEVITTNLVVANLLRICSIVNTNMALTPTLFYHPGPLNTMVDDVSHHFDLPHTQFLSIFSHKYHLQQSTSSYMESYSCGIIPWDRQVLYGTYRLSKLCLRQKLFQPLVLSCKMLILRLK